MSEVTPESLAKVRWRNLNVLYDKPRNKIVLMGQTDEGKAFWVGAGIAEEDSVEMIAMRLQSSLGSLKMHAVREADQTVPITEKEFFAARIDDGRFHSAG